MGRGKQTGERERKRDTGRSRNRFMLLDYASLKKKKQLMGETMSLEM